MEIDKQQILGLLRDLGDEQRAQQAERELPDRIDPERDGPLLSRFGLDPLDLMGRFPGGLGLPDV
jgi:hypothetical protein